MPPERIFGPFFAMVALTGVVWVVLYARRLPFILGSGMTSEQMAQKGYLEQVAPPEVQRPSDNFKNLFEVPVLFYALALYLYVTRQVDGVYLALAWGFVGFRALHSAVHCTFNHVPLRFGLYIISTAAVWGMAARAGWAYLSP